MKKDLCSKFIKTVECERVRVFNAKNERVIDFKIFSNKNKVYIYSSTLMNFLNKQEKQSYHKSEREIEARPHQYKITLARFLEIEEFKNFANTYVTATTAQQQQ